MQPVPQGLLALVKKSAPPEADVVPLSWAFKDEDYNLTFPIYAFGLCSCDFLVHPL
jgi:hypothetical protein